MKVNCLKYYRKSSALTIILLILNISGKAQQTENSLEARNSINAYIGLFELNINYERNIFQSPKSHSNLRLGFGYGMFFTAGEGTYINPAFIHLIGEKSSHLEIDLGVKYMLTNSIEDADFSDTFITDIFLGYRYQKPSGGFMFRFGLNYPTLINLGVGYNF